MKIGTFLAVIMLAVLTVPAAHAAGAVKQAAKPEIRLMYQQVGFWESEVMIEGSDKRIGVSSNEFRELMKTTPKGVEYLDGYTLKHTLGYVGLFGSIGVLFGGSYLMSNTYDYEAALITGTASLVVTLAMYIGGFMCLVYSADDFSKAILEYNRTQVNNGCVTAGGGKVIGYSIEF